MDTGVTRRETGRVKSSRIHLFRKRKKGFKKNDLKPCLNTHTPGSFYEVFPPEEAFDLAQKFQVHYTPKKGSWLNMAEIEFPALSRQCLARRIPKRETLEKEVLAWAENRNKKCTTVSWKFTKDTAREKLKSKYHIFKN
ncbi:MAG: hypothetical protein E3K32_00005 [wastewater metagenome]|nr:hypothetical protein [Candidatus Loosdrechtia aerotolerans]